MNTTPKQYNEDREIDLSHISKKVGEGFQNLGTFIFNCVQFLIKNAIILILLIAVGLGLAYFLEGKKSYEHEIIVMPNFGSADYLYGKIDLINSKIKEGDTVFLKDMGIRYPKRISKLKIQPIIDPYNFIRDNESNFELLKLMSEDGSIDKVLMDKVTSKNYAYHRITFTTKGRATAADVFDPLFKNFNDNDYYKIIQQKVRENIAIKIKANDQTLSQIDGILNKYSKEQDQGARNANLVYINEDTQLDDILETKNELVREQGNRRIELVNNEKIIKEISVIANIEKASASMLIFPILLILLFIVFKALFRFYKSQSLKQKARISNETV